MNSYYYPQQQFRPSLSRVKPVSSIDEVKASPIDFDGSIFYFPDMANKVIYTKQINLDGTALINMYALTEIPVETNNNSNFITREEFNQAIEQLMTHIPKEPKTELRF